MMEPQNENNKLDRAEQLSRMKLLFAQWDDEDRLLTDEEAEVLQKALEENRGLAFRTPCLE